MKQAFIFAPMGALVALTFLVQFLIPVRRFRAAAQGLVKADDFRLGESQGVPAHVSIPNRNYMNLLEMPMLFYVIDLLFFVTGSVDWLVLALAWTYVALRAVHSGIHLSYNRVQHRLIPFAVSNAVLGALWVVFFVKLYA